MSSGLYIGLMSGTSADGIDATLCRFDDRPHLLHALTRPWPRELHARIVSVAQGEGPIELDELGHLDTTIGEAFASAAQALLDASGHDPDAIRAIGSHGQTVRHRPMGAQPFTLQLGNPWVIAERCRIDTVADFRRADIAAGGQGAPLMPAFHATFLGAAGHTHAVLNLGGIANVTVLQGDGHIHGFDTGPANGLLDAWAQRHRGEPLDKDGTFAAQGHCDAVLLDDLLDDPYFALAPPKSTGREYFHLAWLERHPRVADLAPKNVQATLLALTTRSIANALDAHAPTCEEVLVCGGGVHNTTLMRDLARTLSPRTVRNTAEMGVDPDFMEAMGFAWLARQRLLGKPGDIPAVTGARGPRLLGTVHPAPHP